MSRSLSSLSLLTLLVTSSLTTASPTDFTTVPCTFHDYEADKQQLGTSYDNSPGWCGTRYSSLNVARITAISGLSGSLCNACLEITSASGGPSEYVLAVDQKQGNGLDIAKSSFQNVFPGKNPLDPQMCRFRVVENKFCERVCFGSREECTPGVRNLLPAYLLPPVDGKDGASDRYGEKNEQSQEPAAGKSTPKSEDAAIASSHDTPNNPTTTTSTTTSTDSPDSDTSTTEPKSTEISQSPTPSRSHSQSQPSLRAAGGIPLSEFSSATKSSRPCLAVLVAAAVVGMWII